MALVARLLESVAFASLALCERKCVKDLPSLWGWSDELAFVIHLLL